MAGAADFSHLSDKELDQMITAKQSPVAAPPPDLTTLSDADLDKKINAKIQLSNKKPAAEPTNSDFWGSAAHGAAQAATLGYLPELEAGAEYAGDRTAKFLNDKLGLLPNSRAAQFKEIGQELPSFQELRDKNYKDEEKLAKDNPYGNITGQIGGAIASAPLMAGGLAKAGLSSLATPASGLLGRLVQGTASGAIQSAVYNPGEDKGLSDRLENAKTGAGLGLLGQAGGELVGKGINAIKNAPEYLEKLGQVKAFKSAGGMTKAFENAIEKDRIPALGNTMVDEGLVQPGQTFEDVARLSKEKLQDIGQKIGDIYESSKDKFQGTKELGEKLVNAAANNAPKLDAKKYGTAVQGKIDEILSDPEVINGNPKSINEYIGALDELIDHSKKNSELPAIERGYKALRTTLRDTVNDIVESSGIDGLKELNQRYGNLAEIKNISTKRSAREAANRMLSLGDRIGGGAIAAGVLASGDSHDPTSYLKAGLLGGAAALASKGARQYGNPILTKGLLAAGRGLGNVKEAIPSGLLTDAAQQFATNPNMQILNRLKSDKDSRK